MAQVYRARDRVLQRTVAVKGQGRLPADVLGAAGAEVTATCLAGAVVVSPWSGVVRRAA
jgi:hypothetical protein